MYPLIRCKFILFPNFKTTTKVPQGTQVHSSQTHLQFPSLLSPAPLTSENYVAHLLQPFPLMQYKKQVHHNVQIAIIIITLFLCVFALRAPQILLGVARKFECKYGKKIDFSRTIANFLSEKGFPISAREPLQEIRTGKSRGIWR